MSASLSTTSKKLILPPTLPDSRWITGFSTEQIFEGYASVRFKQSLFLSCARTKGDSSFSGHAVFRERWFSRPEIDLGYRLVCPPTQKLPDLFLSFFQGEVLSISICGGILLRYIIYHWNYYFHFVEGLLFVLSSSMRKLCIILNMIEPHIYVDFVCLDQILINI